MPPSFNSGLKPDMNKVQVDRDNQFRFQAPAKFFIHIGTVVAVFVTACPPLPASAANVVNLTIYGIMTDHLVYRMLRSPGTESCGYVSHYSSSFVYDN